MQVVHAAGVVGFGVLAQERLREQQNIAKQLDYHLLSTLIAIPKHKGRLETRGRTVMYLYPNVLRAPAVVPISSAPHGWITILDAVPTATPPAKVAFCM